MIIFDGYALAQKREEQVKLRVQQLTQKGVKLKIAAVLFTEDQGSQLYTGLKREAAERVGIDYQVHEFSLSDNAEQVVKVVKKLNLDTAVTGIIIQKPWRQTWQTAKRVEGEPKDIQQAFASWWRFLTSSIDIKKDVDGLHPQTLESIKGGTWQKKGRVLPATAKAVLEILKESGLSLKNKKIIILGKSDIVGQPLFYELKNQGLNVEMIGSKEFASRVKKDQGLLDADVVVSATGREKLIVGSMVKDGVVVIDVGEPRPDVDFATVSQKTSFITPVPGGVGPMTVVCLLENCLNLILSV